VHMAHIGYPLVGDSTYAPRTRLTKGIGPELRETLLHFGRQALHARKLGLLHPDTDEWMEWEVDLPDDFVHLLDVLEADAARDCRFFYPCLAVAGQCAGGGYPAQRRYFCRPF